jgi:hypothetical protein
MWPNNVVSPPVIAVHEPPAADVRIIGTLGTKDNPETTCVPN